MKYRKKPVVIEAVQFTTNKAECVEFCPIAVDPESGFPELVIPTLEGDMKVSFGDYIIKGVAGEFYPCKPAIFEQTYEKIEEDE